MTTNQFHKRHVSRNPSPPLSPNVERRRRRIVPVGPPKVIATWSFSGTSGGNPVNVLAHYDLVPREDSLLWVKFGLTWEDDVSKLTVLWNPTSAGLSAELKVDVGAGFVHVAGIVDSLYAGQSPYTSPPLVWDVGIGTIELELTGNWFA